MKKALYIILAGITLFCVSSCWKENLPEKGVDRHQVKELVATPGDEEVVLSWTMPEGWNPTDFLITFNDAASAAVEIYTEGAMTYTVTGLQNEFEYSFSVQAIYGDAVSGKVSVAGKPTTSRFPILNPLVDTGDKTVIITWEKPSTLVEGYTATYYMEGDENNAKEVKIGKDALSYEFTGLTNDKNYTFEIVANYAKGDSEAVILKAMPALAIPYFVSATNVSQGWPVNYRFNRADFPDATEVTWTFPDGAVKTGDEVTYGIWAIGEKEVVLSAKVNNVKKEWKIAMVLREWVIATRDFAQNGTTYQGFKGSYPVFSPDGKTVYVITFNGLTGLYAFDVESGVEKWRFLPAAVSGSYNPLTVNPVTGDIYFGTTTAGQFYCVGPDGKQKWMFTGAGNMQSTAPAVSADGSVVYIIDKSGNTFALDASSGTQKWTVALGYQGGQLLINGNDLIVAIVNNTDAIQFLNTSDGSKITSISLTNKPTDISGMAVSDDKKTAYVPLLAGGMARIDLATRTLVKETVIGTNNMYAPAISSTGYLVVGSKDGCVYGVKADLSEVVWTYVHTGTAQTNVFNYSHACADTEGKVYITAGQKTPMNNLVFNAATGDIVEQYGYIDNSDNAERQMGGNNYLNGVLYSVHLGNTGTNGAFIGKYVGGTRKFWGGPGGDICGSSCLQSLLL